MVRGLCVRVGGNCDSRRLKAASCMCGCGRLILVESGTHSWTNIGLDRCFQRALWNRHFQGFFNSSEASLWRWSHPGKKPVSPDLTALRRAEQLTGSGDMLTWRPGKKQHSGSPLDIHRVPVACVVPVAHLCSGGCELQLLPGRLGLVGSGGGFEIRAPCKVHLPMPLWVCREQGSTLHRFTLQPGEGEDGASLPSREDPVFDLILLKVPAWLVRLQPDPAAEDGLMALPPAAGAFPLPSFSARTSSVWFGLMKPEKLEARLSRVLTWFVSSVMLMVLVLLGS